MNIDHGTNEAIEFVSQGAKLTMNLLTFIFEEASKLLEESKNVITGDTREGKLRINELLNKHENGVETLEDNLTKEQVKEYQKELKKLGVDFSVVKNSKDNYSFFFASSQASVIEKSLKNIIERQELIKNNEQVKEAELDLNAEKKQHTENEIENVEKAFIKTKDIENPLDSKEFKDLTEKEQGLYFKLNELDKIEKEIHEKVTSVFDELKQDISDEKESIGKEELNNETNEKQDVKTSEQEVETSEIDTQTKDYSKELLHSELSELSNDELELFEKRMEYENLATAPIFNERETYKIAEEYKNMKENFSKDQIDKINNLDKGIRDLNNFSEKSKGHKLNANEILSETKKAKNARSNEKAKVFSMENVKNMDQKIKKEEETKDKVKDKDKEHTL